MKKHQYRITVEYLANADGQPVDAVPLQFTAPNHDDVFALVAKMRERSGLGADDAARFVVGLKLMSEAMLENKDDPLFAALKPHFGEFMKALKQSR